MLLRPRDMVAIRLRRNDGGRLLKLEHVEVVLSNLPPSQALCVSVGHCVVAGVVMPRRRGVCFEVVVRTAHAGKELGRVC